MTKEDAKTTDAEGAEKAEGAEEAGARTSRLVAPIACVVIGLLTMALIGGAKVVFERSSWGSDLQLWVFGKLQKQLGSIDRNNPVVLLDISGLQGEKPGDVPLLCEKESGGATRGRKPVHCLEEIIGALADQRPLAIAVDVDFSPKPTGYATEDDDKFFDYCLDLKRMRNLPIFLAVNRTKAAPPEAWLGDEKYKELAVAVAANKNDTSRMPLSVKATVSPEPLNTLSNALAQVYGQKESSRPPSWIRGALKDDEHKPHVETQQEGSELTYDDRLVNYSKLDAMEREAKTDISSESVAQTGSWYSDKLVILGNVKHPVAPDIFIIPGRTVPVGGVMLHASATYTLTKEPLFEFAPGVRLGIDLAIAGLIIAAVAVARYRRPDDLSWKGLQSASVVVSVLVVFIAGWGLVWASGVMWLDFPLVAGALFLHPKLETRLESWLRLETLIHKLAARRKRSPAAAQRQPVAEQRQFAAEQEQTPPAAERRQDSPEAEQRQPPTAEQEHAPLKAEQQQPATAEQREAAPVAPVGGVIKVSVLVLAAVLALGANARAQDAASPSCPERCAAMLLKLNINAKRRKGTRKRVGNCYFGENRNDTTGRPLTAADERTKQFRAGQQLWCDEGCSVLLLLCGTRESYPVSARKEKPYRVANVFASPPLVPDRFSDNPSRDRNQSSRLFIPDNPPTVNPFAPQGFRSAFAAPSGPGAESDKTASRLNEVGDRGQAQTAAAQAGDASAPSVADRQAENKVAQDFSMVGHAESRSAATAATSRATRKTAANATRTASTTAVETTAVETAASVPPVPSATPGAAEAAARPAGERSNAEDKSNALYAASNLEQPKARNELEAALESGNRMRDAKQYAVATLAYVEASLIRPNDSRAYYGLGNIYSDQQNWEGAERAYRRAVELEPGFAQAYLALAFALTQQPADGPDGARRLSEAESLLWRAAELRPSDERAYDLLGVVLEKRAADASAFVSAYRRAAALSPGSSEVRLLLSGALRNAGADKEADEQLRQAVELARTPSELVVAAEALESARRYEKAEKLLRAALASEPDNGRALYDLGYVLLLRNHFGEALRSLKAAAAATPGGFAPRFLLALTYLKQKQPAEAEQSLESAAAANSPGERVQLALAYGFQSAGDAYAEAGRLADAERAYNRALGFDPEDRETTDKLSALRARIKH